MKSPGGRPRTRSTRVGDVGEFAEDVAEQVGQEFDEFGGGAVLGGTGGEFLDRHRHVGDVAAARLGDLGDGLGEAQQPGAGQLVDPAGVAGLGERRHRHVGDVVDVDERVELAVVGGEHHLAGPDRVEQEVLAEDLHEPGAAHDGHVGAGGLDLTLGPLGLVLAPAGQHHQPGDAVLDRELCERPHHLRRAGDDQVGVGDVGRPHALQHRRPGRLVAPVEGRLPRTGADPHGEAACAEPFDDPATRLARAAEHQCRLVVV